MLMSAFLRTIDLDGFMKIWLLTARNVLESILGSQKVG